MANDSLVYFALAEGSGRVKIGQTFDIDKRFRISTDCPFPIRVLCTIPETAMHESRVQNALDEFRLHKEWFAASPVILRLAEMIFRERTSNRAALEFLERKFRVFELAQQAAKEKYRDGQRMLEQMRAEESARPYAYVMIEPDLLSATEVAALRGITRQRVLRLIATGRLASVRDPGGRHLIRREDATAFSPNPQGWPKGRTRNGQTKGTKPATKRKPAEELVTGQPIGSSLTPT